MHVQEKKPQAMISENLSEMNLKIWNQYFQDGWCFRFMHSRWRSVRYTVQRTLPIYNPGKCGLRFWVCYVETLIKILLKLSFTLYLNFCKSFIKNLKIKNGLLDSMVNGDYHCFCLFVFLGNRELMCLKTEVWKYDQKYRTIKKTNM